MKGGAETGLVVSAIFTAQGLTRSGHSSIAHRIPWRASVKEIFCMTPETHDFDVLDEWASWSDDDIEKIISDKTIAALQRMVEVLGDETKDSNVVVTKGNFVPMVRELRKLKHEGARALGEAILEASDWLDKQQPARAKMVYENFLSSCTAKFYRDIGRDQLIKIP